MAKQFKTERAAQQQKLICDGLVALMGIKSYSDITVGSICAHIEIPRRTFYYYFNAKEEVLSFLIQQMLKEADLQTMLMLNPSLFPIEEAFTGFFLYWRDHRRDELQALVKNGLEQELMTHCLNWVNEDFRNMPLPEGSTEEIRSVTIRLGITCVFYTLIDWCRNDFRQSPEYMADCVTRVMTKPLYIKPQ